MSTTSTSSSSTTAQPPDFHISSFYGPGSWAAWVIAIISTWITIYQRRFRSDIDLIGFLLYLNWAAIDQSIQNWALIRYSMRNDRGISTPVFALRLQTNAAFSVVLIGTLHGSLLLCAYLRTHRRNESETDRRLLRRWCQILLVGLVLPCIAAWPGLTWQLAYAEQNIYRKGDKSNAGMGSFPHFLLLGALAGVVVFLPYNIYHLPNDILGYSRAWQWQLLYLFTLFVAGAFFTVTVVVVWCLVFDPWEMRDDYRKWLLRFWVVPCTDTSIKEWDQISSLLVALTFFVRGYCLQYVQIVYRQKRRLVAYICSV